MLWTTVETGKIDTPWVVETFTTDRLGLLSSEVVLRSTLLLEAVTTVCDTLGVNTPEKRVVFARGVVDEDLSTTKVCVSTGRDKYVPTLEVGITLVFEGEILLGVATFEVVPSIELFRAILCLDSILDTLGVSKELL